MSYVSNECETVALLNIGASVTTVNILHGAVSQFTRDITNGGNAITEEIQKQLQVSFEEAEAYKAGGGINSQEVIPEEVDEIITGVVDALAAEVQRSLDFFMATTSHGEVERIFLTGGTSKIPHLRTAIEQRAKVQVEPFDPFRRVLFDERQFKAEVLQDQAPQATVCLGLALRKQKERI